MATRDDAPRMHSASRADSAGAPGERIRAGAAVGKWGLRQQATAGAFQGRPAYTRNYVSNSLKVEVKHRTARWGNLVTRKTPSGRPRRISDVRPRRDAVRERRSALRKTIPCQARFLREISEDPPVVSRRGRGSLAFEGNAVASSGGAV